MSGKEKQSHCISARQRHGRIFHVEISSCFFDAFIMKHRECMKNEEGMNN